MSSDAAAAAERFAMALDLYEAGEAITRQNLRRKFPQADEEEIEHLVVQWLLSRPGAPLGDTSGRPYPWPRRTP
jgi:hypothetical protein